MSNQQLTFTWCCSQYLCIKIFTAFVHYVVCSSGTRLHVLAKENTLLTFSVENYLCSLINPRTSALTKECLRCSRRSLNGHSARYDHRAPANRRVCHTLCTGVIRLPTLVFSGALHAQDCHCDIILNSPRVLPFVFDALFIADGKVYY